MKPSWDVAPDWANWLVKDENDQWYFCELEPKIINNILILDLSGYNISVGEFIVPCGTLFIIESRDWKERNDIPGEEVEDRIGLRSESIDWEAHKSFGRSL